jgi:tRNA threonylcarbamoyl adenosine modification protein YeaZ
LLLNGRIVLSDTREMAKGQAEALIPMLDEVLVRTGATWRDLNALGVGIGPGNFTGIRISVSAARGLAMGLSIPAVGVSTLEALAEGHDGPCLALCDARRGAVYAQGFGGHECPAQHVPRDLLSAFLSEHAGAALIADAPLDLPSSTEVHAPVLPLPDAIARVAARRAVPGLPAPAPLYLRAADAAPGKPAPALLPE